MVKTEQCNESGIRNTRSRDGRKGNAVVELAFFMPCLVFLFVGTLDLGMFTYALITVESAAHTAVLYTATSNGTAGDSSGACTYALGEMRSLPNVGSSVSTCSSSPVVVTAASITGNDGATASQVSVTYNSVRLIPIPGLLAGQFTWTRTVTMRLPG